MRQSTYYALSAVGIEIADVAVGVRLASEGGEGATLGHDDGAMREAASVGAADDIW